MQIEGRTLVTRERTTGIMLSPPFPSSYIKFEESMPMVPDPVLRDYLKEDFTFSEYRDCAYPLQNYTENMHPSSRELASVISRHSANINAKSAQLRFFFSNFGSIRKHPGVGSRTCSG